MNHSLRIYCLFALLFFAGLFIYAPLAIPSQEIESLDRSLNPGILGISEKRCTVGIREILTFFGLALVFSLAITLFLRSRIQARNRELKEKYGELEREIRDRRQAEKALLVREEQFRRAISQADAVPYQRDYKEENFRFIGGEIELLTGYKPGEITPEVWHRMIQECVMRGEGAGLDMDQAIRLIREGEIKEWRADYRILTRDGEERWLADSSIQITDEKGSPQASLGILQDITDRKKAEEKILQNAFYDELTKLPNRALLIDRLKLILAHSRRRKNYLFALLILDLDHFKNVNDSLGHGAGDQLLLEISRRLKKCVRPGDTVARPGGDEFMIILDDINHLSDTTQVAGRIQESLSIPFRLKDQDVFTSASMGIALSSSHYKYPEEMIRDADTALNRAKELGRGRHEVFNETMHQRAVNLLKMDADIRRALKKGEFICYFQPIINLETGHTSGFETLLRWKHPREGLLEPQRFVDLCEENGLIIPIFWNTLRESCRRLALWQKEYPSNPPLTISVNLSGRQLSDKGLIENIGKILEENKLEGRSLNLEITERILMDHREETVTTLQQLRDLDVRIHIDDFGTGYSSLSYLHRFPIDAFKIDASFVRNMGGERVNLEIIRTIISLAHSLGHKVTAEGVENHDQFVQLRALKCHLGQGTYFAAPMDRESLERVMDMNPQWGGITHEGFPGKY